MHEYVYDSIGHHGNTAYEHGNGQHPDEYQSAHQDSQQTAHNPQGAASDAQQHGCGNDDEDDPQDYLKGAAGSGAGTAMVSLCVMDILLPAVPASLCAVDILLPPILAFPVIPA